jgi:hypothetical protein
MSELMKDEKHDQEADKKPLPGDDLGDIYQEDMDEMRDDLDDLKDTLSGLKSRVLAMEILTATNLAHDQILSRILGLNETLVTLLGRKLGLETETETDKG